MAGIKKQLTTEVFVGQNDLVLFNEVEDYSEATFESATASGESLGQISGDSSEYAGEDASTENWLDEKGNVITSVPTAGTVAVKFSMANVSADTVAKFLKGTKMEGLTSELFKNVKNAVGFGVELPVITRPIGWFNDQTNRALFLPKAKIVSNLAIDGKKFMISATATAEYLDLKTLKTAMIFNADPVYEENEENEEVTE